MVQSAHGARLASPGNSVTLPGPSLTWLELGLGLEFGLGFGFGFGLEFGFGFGFGLGFG